MSDRPDNRPAGPEAERQHLRAVAPAPDAGQDAARAARDARLRNRAELLRHYARLMGHAVLLADLEAELRQGALPDGAATADSLAAALTESGLATRVKRAPQPTPALWPGLARMSNGQWILVLGQEGAQLLIHDASQPGQQAEVPLGDFAPFFAGEVVQAEPTLEQVADRHGISAYRDHWFWGQFPRFSRALGEVALGSLVANLLAIAVALFSLQVYDRVIPHQSQATLWVLAAGAAIAIVLEAGLRIARARLIDGAGRQIELNVQNLLMSRLLGMRSDARGATPSQLFSAMREFSSVREFFTASTAGAVADIPFVLLFLLVVASIAGPVVWVLVAGGVLMVLPSLFLRKKMQRLTQEMQGATSRSSRLLQEAVTELDTIKTQRGEDRFLRLWHELTALQALTSSGQRQLAATLTFWSQGVQQATYVGAVIAGTYMVFRGEFTVGTIIATGILTGRTLSPLTQLSNTLARWGNVKAALDALDGVAEAAQDHEDGRTYLRRETIEGGFELHDVVFRYEDHAKPVLDVPGLAIQPGQHVAILGTNGSGKSTFLKLLSGLYGPDKGRVMLDGTDMGQIAPRDVRRLVGLMEQEVRLFAGSLRDNLNLNLMEQDDARLFEALDFAGLGQFVKAHPKGLDLEIHDKGAGLSNGQRQSIGWARLWLQDPKVCLLDEPTAALDQTLERTLIARLENWMQGRTVVIATHRVPMLALTSRTLVLQNGRMTVDGPRDKVLEHLTNLREVRG